MAEVVTQMAMVPSAGCAAGCTAVCASGRRRPHTAAVSTASVTRPRSPPPAWPEVRRHRARGLNLELALPSSHPPDAHGGVVGAGDQLSEVGAAPVHACDLAGVRMQSVHRPANREARRPMRGCRGWQTKDKTANIERNMRRGCEGRGQVREGRANSWKNRLDLLLNGAELDANAAVVLGSWLRHDAAAALLL